MHTDPLVCRPDSPCGFTGDNFWERVVQKLMCGTGEADLHRRVRIAAFRAHGENFQDPFHKQRVSGRLRDCIDGFQSKKISNNVCFHQELVDKAVPTVS